MTAEMQTTQFAKDGDIHIAYQVVGDGPMDLVLVDDYSTPLEGRWELPAIAGPLRRLAQFSRLISFDKRGIGCSDPVSLNDLATAEIWVDDVRSVMDAAGSERAAVFGVSEGGMIAALFAAMFPARVSSLVLLNTYAKMARSPDHPYGWSANDCEAILAAAEAHRDAGATFELFAPSLSKNVEARQWWNRWQRYQASPGTLLALTQAWMRIDMRAVLGAVSAPTLVMHRVGNRWCSAAQGQYVAEHIPGARYVELSGGDDYWWSGNTDEIVEQIEFFLTGAHHQTISDRVLTTVLFTDIVGSTQHVADAGDHQWNQVLNRFYSCAREQVGRSHGQLVKTTGDGFLATFDGPARAIGCACALRVAATSLGLQTRAGVHTGECVMTDGDISGIAVHMGARVMGQADAGEVLVSNTVVDLVAGSGLRFCSRGSHALKGIPGEWQLFAVE